MDKVRPVIALNAGIEADLVGEMVGVRPAYGEALLRAGALPILMPPLADPAMIAEFVDRVDGFVLVGGDDISSRRIGVEGPPTIVPMNPRREASDFLLLECLLERRKPTLAICLGCQEINLIHGGSLYQDLPWDGPPDILRHYTRASAGSVLHPIRWEAESLLGRIWPDPAEILVSSSHHQGIRRLGAGLRATAWAPDDLIEAIEVQGQPFFLGVQWHPERAANDAAQEKLFAALAREALE